MAPQISTSDVMAKQSVKQNKKARPRERLPNNKPAAPPETGVKNCDYV
jgi:hypothetical protein